jgi:hypothetical protein
MAMKGDDVRRHRLLERYELSPAGRGRPARRLLRAVLRSF